MIPDARDTQPNLCAHSEELYLATYPVAPGTTGPITLPSGYQPQCNPCSHPRLPAPFVYHDHIITGAPGMGTSGTAGAYKARWKIIIVRYNPLYALSPTFTPIKSAADFDAAESAGRVFLPINPQGSNLYEIDKGNVLICASQALGRQGPWLSMSVPRRPSASTQSPWGRSSCACVQAPAKDCPTESVDGGDVRSSRSQ